MRGPEDSEKALELLIYLDDNAFFKLFRKFFNLGVINEAGDNFFLVQ